MKLGLRHRSRHLRRLPRLRHRVQGMERRRRRSAGRLSDYEPFGAEPSGVWFNRVRHYEVGEYPASKTINFPMSCLHCEDADCVTRLSRPARRTSAPTASCWSIRTSAWAATCAHGRARTARASSTQASGTMKKCTLCVDRIYDELLPPEERQPACVLACPTHARHLRRLRRSAVRSVSRSPPSVAASACCPSWATRRSIATCRRASRNRLPGVDDARALLERGLASLASPRDPAMSASRAPRSR